jgi:hypothetical protein
MNINFKNTPPKDPGEYSLCVGGLESLDYFKDANPDWQKMFKLRSKLFLNSSSTLTELDFLISFEHNLRVAALNSCYNYSPHISQIKLNYLLKKRLDEALFCLNNEPVSLEKLIVDSLAKKEKPLKFVLSFKYLERNMETLPDLNKISLSSYREVVLSLLPFFVDYRIQSKRFRSLLTPSLDQTDTSYNNLDSTGLIDLETKNIFIHHVIIKSLDESEQILKNVLAPTS